MKKAKEDAISLGQTFLGKELLEAFSKEYEDITAGEYLDERLREIGLKK